jgi:hypothetical protein
MEPGAREIPLQEFSFLFTFFLERFNLFEEGKSESDF